MPKNKKLDKLALSKWRKQGATFKAAEYRLRDTEFTHQWAIVDWMHAGVKAFGKEDAYRVALKATGMTKLTLEQFAHAARNVLIRVKGVSFGHHRLVAKLKATNRYSRKQRQRAWLIKARNKHWSVAEFYTFNDGKLRLIVVTIYSHTFDVVVASVTERYNRKPDTARVQYLQNAMGAQWEVGEAVWQLSNSTRCTVQERIVDRADFLNQYGTHYTVITMEKLADQAATPPVKF
jgi:hypothetical protein